METISSPDIQTEENNDDFYIVGSSLLREVRENDIQNGTVKCIRGGKIDDMKKDIDEIQGSPKNIVTQIGGNDLEDENTTVEELTSQYEVLITEAKKKFPNSNIIISGLPPRFNKDTTRKKVKDFNESMKTWSNQNKITFVNNESLFEFKNGDVDLDSYVMSGDMPVIHLNRKGTNKLLDNLQKNIPDLILADRRQRQEPVNQPIRSYSKVVTQAPVNEHSRDERQQRGRDGSWQYQGRRPKTATGGNKEQHQRRRERGCYNCGETNHKVQQCRYDSKIRCMKCDRLGHKSKFCVAAE